MIYLMIIIATITLFSLFQVVNDGAEYVMEDNKWGYYVDYCDAWVSEKTVINDHTTQIKWYKRCNF